MEWEDWDDSALAGGAMSRPDAERLWPVKRACGESGPAGESQLHLERSARDIPRRHGPATQVRTVLLPCR